MTSKCPPSRLAGGGDPPGGGTLAPFPLTCAMGATGGGPWVRPWRGTHVGAKDPPEGGLFQNAVPDTFRVCAGWWWGRRVTRGSDPPWGLPPHPFLPTPSTQLPCPSL